MTERRKQTEFLKVMVHHADSPRLLDRLVQAEHDERCLVRAIKLVALVGLLAAAALVYSAVLGINPRTQQGPSVVDRCFTAVALGAAVCLASFLVGLIYYRSLANQVSRECRRYVMAMLETKPASEGTSPMRPQVAPTAETNAAPDRPTTPRADSFIESPYAI